MSSSVVPPSVAPTMKPMVAGCGGAGSMAADEIEGEAGGGDY